MMTGVAGYGGRGAGARAAAVSLPHKSHSPRSEKKDKALRYYDSSCDFLAESHTHTYIHTYIIHPHIYITLLRIHVR